MNKTTPTNPTVNPNDELPAKTVSSPDTLPTKTGDIAQKSKSINYQRLNEEKPVGPQIISREVLWSAGSHYSGYAEQWNINNKDQIVGKRLFSHRVKMGRFTSTVPYFRHVVNYNKIIESLATAYEFVHKLALEHKTILFVGTKKAAREIIREEALRVDMPFIRERWLGGTFTNFQQIHHQIRDLVLLSQNMQSDYYKETLQKKELVRTLKKIGSLYKFYEGVLKMHQLPDAIFVIDPNKEKVAINEARKLGIPIIAFMDTTCDRTQFDYPILGNVTSFRTIKYVVGIMADAVAKATNQPQIFAYRDNPLLEYGAETKLWEIKYLTDPEMKTYVEQKIAADKAERANRSLHNKAKFEGQGQKTLSDELKNSSFYNTYRSMGYFDLRKMAFEKHIRIEKKWDRNDLLKALIDYDEHKNITTEANQLELPDVQNILSGVLPENKKSDTTLKPSKKKLAEKSHSENLAAVPSQNSSVQPEVKLSVLDDVGGGEIIKPDKSTTLDLEANVNEDKKSPVAK